MASNGGTAKWLAAVLSATALLFGAFTYILGRVDQSMPRREAEIVDIGLQRQIDNISTRLDSFTVTQQAILMNQQAILAKLNEEDRHDKR